IALIPVYVALGVSSALSRKILWQMLLVGCALASLVALAAPFWTAHILGSAPEQTSRLTVSMIWILYPAMCVVFTTSAWKARANASDRFLLPAAAGLLPSLFLIGGAVLTARLGPHALSLGLCLGLLLQWLLVRSAAGPRPEPAGDAGMPL